MTAIMVQMLIYTLQKATTKKATSKQQRQNKLPNGHYHTVTTKQTTKRHMPIYVLPKKNTTKATSRQHQLQNSNDKTNYQMTTTTQ